LKATFCLARQDRAAALAADAALRRAILQPTALCN
jgi:hypothetical protein